MLFHPNNREPLQVLSFEEIKCKVFTLQAATLWCLILLSPLNSMWQTIPTCVSGCRIDNMLEEMSEVF